MVEHMWTYVCDTCDTTTLWKGNCPGCGKEYKLAEFARVYSDEEKEGKDDGTEKG